MVDDGCTSPLSGLACEEGSTSSWMGFLKSAGATNFRYLSPCHLEKKKKVCNSQHVPLQHSKHTLQVVVSKGERFLSSFEFVLPYLWAVVTVKDIRQQLRGLLKTASQLVQLLLHGEDPLLQLPIRVIPVGTEVTHDHLHLRLVNTKLSLIQQ